MDKPEIIPVHTHIDGRRALFRYTNGVDIRQSYMVEIRPGVTTAWHGHERQTDYWVVLEGVLQVGVAKTSFHNAGFTENPKSYWLSGSMPQVFRIPPGWWHGYHNAGPEMVKLLNMTTTPYDEDNPDELRMDPFFWPDFWGKVPAQ